MTHPLFTYSLLFEMLLFYHFCGIFIQYSFFRLTNELQFNLNYAFTIDDKYDFDWCFLEYVLYILYNPCFYTFFLIIFLFFINNMISLYTLHSITYKSMRILTFIIIIILIVKYINKKKIVTGSSFIRFIIWTRGLQYVWWPTMTMKLQGATSSLLIWQNDIKRMDSIKRIFSNHYNIDLVTVR